MRNYIINLFCIFILFSCNPWNDNKQTQSDNPDISPESKNSRSFIDGSLSYMEMMYDSISGNFKDSITKTLNDYPISSKLEGLDNSMIEYITNTLNGDTESYDWLILESQLYYDIDYLPYSLYMTDNYQYPNAYTDILTYFGHKNFKNYVEIKGDSMSYSDARFIRKDLYNLDYISTEERALALSYLIKGYRKNNQKSIYQLSHYFRIGRYFPKDTLMSEKLDSVILKIKNSIN